MYLKKKQILFMFTTLLSRFRCGNMHASSVPISFKEHERRLRRNPLGN